MEWFNEVIPWTMWVLLAVSLLATVHGFRTTIDFITTGYGFAMVGMALSVILVYYRSISVSVFLQCGLLGFFGLRLALFLWWRDRQASFQTKRVEIEQAVSKVSFILQIIMWLGVATLYVSMLSPALYKAELLLQSEPLWLLTGPGLAIMTCGCVLEAVADHQKAEFKKEHPKRFCDVGLYRWVQSPNLLGDLLVWVGNWLAGVGGYRHWFHWTLSLIGLVLISYVLIDASNRLEVTHKKQYGTDKEFMEYEKAVPKLLPGLSLYTPEASK